MKTIFRSGVIGAGLILMSTTNIASAADWYPSAYGADDEIGAANLLSDELALKAAKLVTTGKVYPLGIETNSKTPAFAPRGFKIYVVQPNQQAGQTLGPNKMTYNDDVVEGWFGVGTQIDGLGHLGIDNLYYNGLKAADFATPSGLTKLGIEKVPPIVTKGVLLDMAAHFGVERLEAGHAFNSADIKAAEKAQGITIEKGDVVLFHTGWMSMLDEDPVKFASGAPGLGRDGAKYLASLGVIAIGGDSTALEAVPHEEGSGNYEVHQILLAKNGVYILENIDSRALAADKAYEFMFMLSPAKITGAVQMIVNPIAIR
jgi:kynurenine formamidase